MNPNIISNAPALEFDGIFRFTNATDEDFSVMWNSIEYTFPKQSTSPMIIAGESPENVQNIRKLFAKKLAEREFYKSSEYSRLVDLGKGSGMTYDEKVLEAMIQTCLEPLPLAKATTRVVPKQDDSVFEDKIEAVDPNESLIERGKKGKKKDLVEI